MRSVERKRLTICLRIPPLSSTRGGLGGAGAADDRRAAAPSLERHGAAGEPPAPCLSSYLAHFHLSAFFVFLTISVSPKCKKYSIPEV